MSSEEYISRAWVQSNRLIVRDLSSDCRAVKYTKGTRSVWVSDPVRRTQHASIISGNPTGTDIVNYFLGMTGLGLNVITGFLEREKNDLIARSTRTSLTKVKKLVDPSIDKLGKIAKGLGVAGLAVNVVKNVNKLWNGDGITYSDAVDLVVTGALAFATITNPALLVGFGIYGVLDATGALNGIKESLGGSEVLLNKNDVMNFIGG